MFQKEYVLLKTRFIIITVVWDQIYHSESVIEFRERRRMERNMYVDKKDKQHRRDNTYIFYIYVLFTWNVLLDKIHIT